ncbi:Putative membrane-spanning protein [Tenacibaculum discolor]
MIHFLGVICVLILFSISLIHVYWAFGGTLWVDAVIPTKTANEKAMNPPKALTFLVAIVIGAFAVVYAEKIQLFTLNSMPTWLQDYGLYVVASIFIIRAIGDFKYVGFFKKTKATEFAVNDTKYFSPLCLFLGVVGLLIAL